MSEQDLINLLARGGVASWRQSLGRWVESGPVQKFIIAVILLNGWILGLETSDGLMERFGSWLLLLDKLCLAVFIVEIAIKVTVYRLHFWRNGWNWFVPFIVVATFTILNLFIGIIASTMQELQSLPDPKRPNAALMATLHRMESDLATLRSHINNEKRE